MENLTPAAHREAWNKGKIVGQKTPLKSTVQATVDNVSADAVVPTGANDKKVSYYPATLTLDKKAMQIDGKLIPISAGMNVTAEIKTGKRKIIEYLLSPVQRAGSESFRER